MTLGFHIRAALSFRDDISMNGANLLLKKCPFVFMILPHWLIWADKKNRVCNFLPLRVSESKDGITHCCHCSNASSSLNSFRVHLSGVKLSANDDEHSGIEFVFALPLLRYRKCGR